MEPTISRGSLVLISEFQDYQINDIITFTHKDSESNEVLITHRLVDIKVTDNAVLFKTKGDANTGNDLDLIDQTSVIGKVIFSIPVLGLIISFAKSKIGVVLLIVIPCTILFWGEIQNIIKEIKKMRTKGSAKPLLLLLLLILVLITSSTYAVFSDSERIFHNAINTGEWNTDNNEVIDQNCGVRVGNPHLEKCRKPQPTPDPPGNANGLEGDRMLLFSDL
jgi:signal peptidase